VEVERLVPVPRSLTEPCAAICGEIITNGDLLLCLHRHKQAMRVCNARLQEIRLLPLNLPQEGT